MNPMPNILIFFIMLIIAWEKYEFKELLYFLTQSESVPGF